MGEQRNSSRRIFWNHFKNLIRFAKEYLAAPTQLRCSLIFSHPIQRCLSNPISSIHF